MTKVALMERMNARAKDAPQVEAAPLGEVLGRLAGMGLALGVATNDTEGPARAHLRAAGVEEAFGFIAGFDSGWGAKPGAGQLLAFAEAQGLDPSACAMVGDSLHDLAAARTAGMVGIGVLTGVAGRETLGAGSGSGAGEHRRVAGLDCRAGLERCAGAPNKGRAGVRDDVPGLGPQRTH
jgi:phosphoglycolate phosphatase